MVTETAVSFALKLLSHRAYPWSKLSTRLLQAGFSEPEIGQCLERLINWGYINDREYGMQRITTLLERLKSRFYVEKDLEEQGLDLVLIAGLLEEYYPPATEIEIAQRLLQKKKPSQNTRIWAFGVLNRAGFSESTIHHCFPDISPT